ncbi:unnamed protein product [Camellia sinensis]
MAGKEQENRIFVGGLDWDVTERQLESAFTRFGKIVDSQIMVERDTGRPRGFGFLTFADRRAMEDAIREMHGRELGDRVISVNRAQPKMGGDDPGHGYSEGYSSGGRGSYGGGDRSAGQDDCFKCGRPGHWARDCPSAGGGRGGGEFPFRSRFGGRGDRFGGDRDRYIDDRYDGGRYGDRDRYNGRDKYGSNDRNVHDRGIRLVEIVLQGIGMEVQTVTRKMGMAKMEAMIGMEVQEGAMTGMEVEGHHAMREEVTGIGQLHMTAPGEEGAHLLSIATENFDFCCSLVNFSDACVYSF